MMYWAVALNIGSLAGNIYMNTVLLGLTDIPGLLFIVFIANRAPFGRRLTSSLSAILAGIIGGVVLSALILHEGKYIIICYKLLIYQT